VAGFAHRAATNEPMMDPDPAGESVGDVHFASAELRTRVPRFDGARLFSAGCLIYRLTIRTFDETIDI
jgi:hypothetical protein